MVVIDRYDAVIAQNKSRKIDRMGIQFIQCLLFIPMFFSFGKIDILVDVLMGVSVAGFVTITCECVKLLCKMNKIKRYNNNLDNAMSLLLISDLLLGLMCILILIMPQSILIVNVETKICCVLPYFVILCLSMCNSSISVYNETLNKKKDVTSHRALLLCGSKCSPYVDEKQCDSGNLIILQDVKIKLNSGTKFVLDTRTYYIGSICDNDSRKVLLPKGTKFRSNISVDQFSSKLKHDDYCILDEHVMVKLFKGTLINDGKNKMILNNDVIITL